MNETKEKAKQIFLDSEGLAKPSEIAESLGIDSSQVRKWKCVGKWEEELKNKPKKRGGQRETKTPRVTGPHRETEMQKRTGHILRSILTN